GPRRGARDVNILPSTRKKRRRRRKGNRASKAISAWLRARGEAPQQKSMDRKILRERAEPNTGSRPRCADGSGRSLGGIAEEVFEPGQRGRRLPADPAQKLQGIRAESIHSPAPGELEGGLNRKDHTGAVQELSISRVREVRVAPSHTRQAAAVFEGARNVGAFQERGGPPEMGFECHLQDGRRGCASKGQPGGLVGDAERSEEAPEA